MAGFEREKVGRFYPFAIPAAEVRNHYSKQK